MTIPPKKFLQGKLVYKKILRAVIRKEKILGDGNDIVAFKVIKSI